MIVYGTKLCPDCVQCMELLAEHDIGYEFRDITANLKYLKELLSLRDHRPEFEEPRKEGYIGIPCLLFEDGSISLDPEAWIYRK